MNELEQFKRKYELLKLENAILKEKALHSEDLLATYRYDSLTGFKLRKDFNDRYLDYFNEEVNFYLTIVDINGLKAINDKQGYLEGDNTIKRVANYLLANCKGCMFRIGGDEFVILSIQEPNCGTTDDFVWKSVASRDYKDSRSMFKDCDILLKDEKNTYYARTGKERRK